MVIEDNSSPIEGITYDETVYCIEITVADNGEGDLVASVVIRTAGGSPVDRIEFNNTYNAAPPPTGGPSLTFWVALMMCSIVGLIALLTVMRNRKEEVEE